MENWKDIPGYEGLYQASNMGRVKGIKNNKVLKPYLTGSYLTVRLSNKGIVKMMYIHQLVAMAFLGHIPDGHNTIIDHIDNNSLNNNTYNLQIISQRENLGKDRESLGAHWHKTKKQWTSSIYIGGKLNHLGQFKTKDEAHKSYQEALKKINTNGKNN